MSNMEEYFNKVRELIVGKKIKGVSETTTTARDGFGRKVTGDALVLEDGTTLSLYMSESDCCAGARGEWDTDDRLEAGITDIQFNIHDEFSEAEWDDGSHFSRATITVLHNQNGLATAECYANDGNAGYYFSMLNLEVVVPNSSEVLDETILSC